MAVQFESGEADCSELRARAEAKVSVKLAKTDYRHQYEKNIIQDSPTLKVTITTLVYL